MGTFRMYLNFQLRIKIMIFFFWKNNNMFPVLHFRGSTCPMLDTWIWVFHFGESTCPMLDTQSWVSPCCILEGHHVPCWTLESECPRVPVSCDLDSNEDVGRCSWEWVWNIGKQSNLAVNISPLSRSGCTFSQDAFSTTKIRADYHPTNVCFSMWQCYKVEGFHFSWVVKI